MMWLNRFTGSQPSLLLQKLCDQKDRHVGAEVHGLKESRLTNRGDENQGIVSSQ